LFKAELSKLDLDDPVIDNLLSIGTKVENEATELHATAL